MYTRTSYAIGKIVEKNIVLINHHHFEPIEFITVNGSNLISLSNLIFGQSPIALTTFIASPLKRPLSFWAVYVTVYEFKVIFFPFGMCFYAKKKMLNRLLYYL